MSTRSIWFAAGTAAIALSSATAGAEEIWQVRGGVTSVSLFRSMIGDLGLRLAQLRQTAKPIAEMEDPIGFAVSRKSSLTFAVRGGNFYGWNEGQLLQRGGFTLLSGSRGSAVQDFSIVRRETGTPDNLFVGSGGNVVFELSAAKIFFDKAQRRLVIGAADMLLSAEAAKALGRPDLAGQLIGVMTVNAHAEKVGGEDKEPKREAGAGGDNIDVQLFELSSLTSLGRLGVHPDGVNGLSMLTTSCNTGSDNIPWYAPMDERHPVIAMNLYRLHNGRFEQIGVSWLKHGFYATNSLGCGVCINPGTPALLGPGCSDTYGTGNNGDRYYLGPRSEVNAFTGRWTCRGSWFANNQDDCVRRNGNGVFTPVEHRLEVRDADLNVAGASFVYEAYYICQQDTDRYNSIGYRPATATWSAVNQRWSFSSTAVMSQGAAINSWGDMRAFGLPRSDGDLILAAKVTDLGGGTWHYEYALYNHTSDRKVRSFVVPVRNGLTVQNIEFHDVDQDAANNWQSSYSNGRIMWWTDTYAQNPSANALPYSTVFNFRFDANAPPVDAVGALGLFKPGTEDTLTVATKSPQTDPAVYPTGFSVFRGVVIGGGLGNLLFSDDSYLLLRPGVVLSNQEAPVQVLVDGTSPAASPTELRFTLEAAANISNITQKIELYNYMSQTWVLVDSRLATTGDSVVEAAVTGFTSGFIQVGTRAMRTRLSWKEAGPVLSYPWQLRIDQSIWKVVK